MRDSKGNLTSAKAFKVQLLIRNASDGNKYLYDVVKIKEDTITANNLYNSEVMRAANAAQQKSVSYVNTIHESDPVVNTEDIRYLLRT